MKKLNITWEEGVEDTTGFLLSFMKALGTVVKNSPYVDYAEDIIASSGFAFRMWVDEKELSLNAVCNWGLSNQKQWVENGGLLCEYVGSTRAKEVDIEVTRREAANIIRESIGRGLPAISWNIGGSEWGLITGYDDEKSLYYALTITGAMDQFSYDLLGYGEEFDLSILTITGIADKSQKEILENTLSIAAAHLQEEENCSYVTGLEAYSAFLHFIEDGTEDNLDWNIEYFLGTFAGLKYYAYKFFKKYEIEELTKLYHTVYDNWKKAFDLKRSQYGMNEVIREQISNMLKEAYEAEKAALAVMENYGGIQDA